MHNEYDPRDLQRKALERWEKQQETWNKLEQRLHAQRLLSEQQSKQMQYKRATEEQQQQEEEYITTHAATSNTMLNAPTEYCKKKEVNSLLSLATSPAKTDGQYAWEDTLRCSSNDTCHMRTIPINKTTYPYMLYSQVNNNNSNDIINGSNNITKVKEEGITFTRIIHSDEIDGNNESTESNLENTNCTDSVNYKNKKKIDSKQSVGIDSNSYNNNNKKKSGNNREKKLANTFPARNKPSRVREKLEMQLTSNYVTDEFDEVQRKAESYLARQLHSVQPMLQKRFPYFLTPRRFLEVVGHAAPTLPSSAAVMEESNKISNLDNQQRKNMNNELSELTTSKMEKVPYNRQQYEQEHEQQNESSLQDANNVKYSNTDNNINKNDKNKCYEPFLSLSSRCLTFVAIPHKLVHQTLRVENTSHVTVFYTITPIDSWQEQTETVQIGNELQKEVEEEQEKEEEVQDNEKVVVQEVLSNNVTSKLHTLAENYVSGFKFFYLSNESNGVIYPKSFVEFAFSLRSPRAGRFRQTYELLTVPASSTRILIELTGLVQHNSASLFARTTSMHHELEHKTLINTQRQLVRELVNSHDPYEAAEIESAIMTIHNKTKDEEHAKERIIAQHRRQWDDANAETMCDIAFNRAIYNSLNALYENVCATLIKLSCPIITHLHCKWNGSIGLLLHILSLLRDNSLRELLYDAVMVLLRASRVSLNEEEPLQLLLHRAAIVCVLENERQCLELHSNRILDWQASCEDETLKKLDVLRNQAVPLTTPVNGTNGRKSRSLSPHTAFSTNTNPITTTTNNNNNNNDDSKISNAAVRGGVGARSKKSNNNNNSNSSSRKSSNNNSARNNNTYCNEDDSKNTKKHSNITHSQSEYDEDNIANFANVNHLLGLRNEYEVLMREYTSKLIQMRWSKVNESVCRFRQLVEMCCTFPLLDVVHATRADDIACIQSAPEIEVDTANPASAIALGSSNNNNNAGNAPMLASNANMKGNVNINVSGNVGSGRAGRRK